MRCSPVCQWRSWSAGQRLALPLTAPALAGAATLRDLALNGNAHRPGRAGDDLLCGFDRGRVQVWHLDLGDLTDLGLSHGANLGLVRLAAALLHARGLLDQLRSRRRLGDEGERAILVDGDLYRDDVAALALRRRVVLLDEVHDVDAVRAERRAHGRGRRGRTRVQLHLDERSDLLLPRSHRWSLPH